MNADEVWATLQIDPAADEMQVQRAYARRVKVCRPDEDPVAFQKLVEARDAALAILRRGPHSDDAADDPDPSREATPRDMGAQERGGSDDDDFASDGGHQIMPSVFWLTEWRRAKETSGAPDWRAEGWSAVVAALAEADLHHVGVLRNSIAQAIFDALRDYSPAECWFARDDGLLEFLARTEPRLLFAAKQSALISAFGEKAVSNYLLWADAALQFADWSNGSPALLAALARLRDTMIVDREHRAVKQSWLVSKWEAVFGQVRFLNEQETDMLFDAIIEHHFDLYLPERVPSVEEIDLDLRDGESCYRCLSGFLDAVRMTQARHARLPPRVDVYLANARLVSALQRRSSAGPAGYRGKGGVPIIPQEDRKVIAAPFRTRVPLIGPLAYFSWPASAERVFAYMDKAREKGSWPFVFNAAAFFMPASALWRAGLNWQALGFLLLTVAAFFAVGTFSEIDKAVICVALVALVLARFGIGLFISRWRLSAIAAKVRRADDKRLFHALERQHILNPASYGRDYDRMYFYDVVNNVMLFSLASIFKDSYSVEHLGAVAGAALCAIAVFKIYERWQE